MTFSLINVNAQISIENFKSQPYLQYANGVNCDSAITTLELRICANLAYQKSDSILNSTYQEIISELDDHDQIRVKNQLKVAQQNWISFRDEHCEIYSDIYEGGSLSMVIFMQCLDEVTHNRIQELQTLLDQLKY